MGSYITTTIPYVNALKNAREANRYVNHVKPWELHAVGAPLDEVLGSLYQTCRVLATELAPFLPDATGRITARLARASPESPLQSPSPVFRRVRRAAAG